MTLILFISLLTGSIIHWKHRREVTPLVLHEFERCMDKDCLADPEPRAEVLQ